MHFRYLGGIIECIKWHWNHNWKSYTVNTSVFKLHRHFHMYTSIFLLALCLLRESTNCDSTVKMLLEQSSFNTHCMITVHDTRSPWHNCFPVLLLSTYFRSHLISNYSACERTRWLLLPVSGNVIWNTHKENQKWSLGPFLAVSQWSREATSGYLWNRMARHPEGFKTNVHVSRRLSNVPTHYGCVASIPILAELLTLWCWTTWPIPICITTIHVLMEILQTFNSSLGIPLWKRRPLAVSLTGCDSYENAGYTNSHTICKVSSTMVSL